MFLNQELFWMNNKAIDEFGFRKIWRIKKISEGVIHRGQLNSSYPTQPHSLIAIIIHSKYFPDSDWLKAKF